MKKRLLFIIDLLEVSARRFYKDKLPQRANAIAYSLLISIVPLLTIAMRFTNVNREEIRFQLFSFFQLYGITGADPVINALDDILGRSNTIAGIGLLFMVYAAINIFKYLEETANHIFRVKPRPLLIRNSIFTSLLVVIPFILVIGGSVLSDIQKSYSHPAIIDMRIDKQRLFILREGHKLSILDLASNRKSEREIQYLNKTDFQVPGRNISPEAETIDRKDDTTSISPAWRDNLGPAQKLYISGDRIYITAKPNFLFFSLDAGQSWDYRIFQSNYDRGISIPRIEAFRPESNRILLLLSSPRGSRLLVLHPERIEVLANQSFREMYRSLFFLSRKNLYIMAARGSIIESNNGLQWSEPKPTTGLAEPIVDLIDRDEPNEWLALTTIGRVVILDDNLQSTFPPLHLPTISTVTGLKRDSTGRIYIWTRSGEVRMSLDQGDSWVRVDLQRPETSMITAFLATENGFFLGTDKNVIYNFEVSRIKLTKPDEIPIVELKNIETKLPSYWRPLISHTLVNLLSFIILQLLFALSYLLLPNKVIKFKAAWLAALLTSSIALIFTILFRQSIPLFVNMGMIYGIWVALPLGLMVLLFLIQFFLLGLEIARFLDSPRLIRRGMINSTLHRLFRSNKT